MEENLDFSLPEKKQGKGAWGMLFKLVTNLLLLIVVLLLINDLLTRRENGGAGAGAAASGLSAEQTKALATKLAQRDLYEQAAKVWRDYLAASELTDAERARALFQVGTLLEKAGRYDEAIEQYYRSEMAAKVDELKSEINAHVKNCFEKLGRFSALRYELMERTGLPGSEDPAGKVAAEIGAEKITVADIDAQIEASIESQLAPVSAFMTAEQMGEQKKKMLEQYSDPQAKLQFARSWVAQEILYREALAAELGKEAEVKKLLDEMTRGALSQQLMNRELASKINITQGDVQTYYEANKGKYVDPAKARISHILVSEEQQAKDLLKQIKDGGDFATLAKEFSLDEATKGSGGAVDADVTIGAYVAGIGDANEINLAIFAAAAPAVLDRVFKTEKGWEIVKVESKAGERQRGFDEVSQEVMMSLMNQKRQEVQQEYINQMMDKYGAIVHASAFAPSRQGPGPDAGGGKQ